MANAPRDDNFVPGKLGIWCVDGRTKIPIAINDSNNGVKVDTVSTISYTPFNIDPRDDNWVDVWAAQGSDGKFYPINVNASGAVLIEP